MKNVLFAFLWLLSFTTVLAVNTKIVSDNTWTVTDASGTFLGNAQNVCLNAPTAPSNCPPGATSYGYVLGGWNANLSAFPGATWIWAPGIKGTSSHAANAEFTFQTQYFLCCDAENGSISIAADNRAYVYIDGVLIDSVLDHNTPKTFIIPSRFLLRGYHVIKVKAKNGPNPDDCKSDQYSCNPAGMIFGASIKDALHDLPKCTSDGKQYDAGYNDLVDCTVDGKAGKRSRTCACITCDYSDWVYGDCTILPQPCQLAISTLPSLCDPASNSYSLDVVATYLNAPSGGIVINGQNFPSNGGSGSQTFTLPSRLTANGVAGVLVNAFFAADAACSTSKTYNAPASCKPPGCKLSIDSVVPSACNPTDNTYSIDVKVSYSNPPPGAMIAINERAFPSDGSGSQTFTLDKLDAKGDTEDLSAVVIVFFQNHSDCLALDIYNAPTMCGCKGIKGGDFEIGETEKLPCPTGCGSEQTRTCLLSADGTKGEWSPLIGCKEMVKEGELCWKSPFRPEDEKCCPEGFHCELRPLNPAPPCRKPWWCIFNFWGDPRCCPKSELKPADWICVPN